MSLVSCLFALVSSLLSLLFALVSSFSLPLLSLSLTHSPSLLLSSQLLKAVAERGELAHWLESAHASLERGHHEHALIKYLFAADWGFEVAQSNAAHLLETVPFSHNTSSLERLALINWKRAAQQGSVEAKIRVGDFYYYGQGLEVDYERAAGLYTEAEQLNSAQAMYNLGYMHERGEGIAKDLHLAKRFYDRAIVTSEEAHLPASLALLLLGVKLMLNGELSFYLYGDEKVAAAAKVAATGAAAAAGAQVHGGVWSVLLNSWEDNMMFVLLGFLLVLLVIRRFV